MILIYERTDQERIFLLPTIIISIFSSFWILDSITYNEILFLAVSGINQEPKCIFSETAHQVLALTRLIKAIRRLVVPKKQ